MPGRVLKPATERDTNSLTRRMERLERKRLDVGVPIRRPGPTSPPSKYDLDTIARIRSGRLRAATDFARFPSNVVTNALMDLVDGTFVAQLSGANAQIQPNAYSFARFQIAGAANRAGVFAPVDPNNAVHVHTFDDSADWYVAASAGVPTLSAPGDTFRTYVGAITNPPVAGVPADGFYFISDTTGANWQCLTTSSAASTTTTDSGVAIATGTDQNELLVHYDATIPDVKFYVDGNLVATHTTDLPPDGVSLVTGAVIRQATGTAARFLFSDWLLIDVPDTRIISDFVP